MPGIEGSRLRRLEVRGRGLRAITRFTTVLAVLVGVVELGLRVILGMVAGIPLNLTGGEAFVPTTILPQVNHLNDLSTGPCADGVCPTIMTPMRVLEVPLGIRALGGAAVSAEAIGIVVALLAAGVVLRGIAAGDAFTARTIDALRVAAGALLAGTLARTLLGLPLPGLIAAWLQSLRADPSFRERQVGTGLGVDPVYVNLPLVTVALITASLVVAFRAGARLERDAVRVI